MSESANTKKNSEARVEEFRMRCGFETHGDPALIQLVTECASFWGAIRRQERPRWLVLVGETGTGKMHLARRLMQFSQLLCLMHSQGNVSLGPRDEGKSYEARFFSWPQVTSGFYRGDYAIVEDMRDEWFAVVDDIGSTRTKTEDLVIDQLFQILDGRYNKWTVVTSNKSLSELARMDVRIYDRLLRRGSQLVITETLSYSMR